jgi:hypothetical protein
MRLISDRDNLALSYPPRLPAILRGNDCDIVHRMCCLIKSEVHSRGEVHLDTDRAGDRHIKCCKYEDCIMRHSRYTLSNLVRHIVLEDQCRLLLSKMEDRLCKDAVGPCKPAARDTIRAHLHIHALIN